MIEPRGKKNRAGGASKAEELRDVLRDFTVPAGLVLVFILAGFLVQWTQPFPGMMRPLAYFPSYLLFPFLALYSVTVILAWHRWGQRWENRWVDGKEGWRIAWAEAVEGALSRPRRVRLAVAALYLPLMLNTFGSWKLAIPCWGGFHRETTVMEWSRTLNGGVQGWHLLQPVLGHPVVTFFLDRIYYTWLPVFVTVVLWQVVWREPARERRRFILALTMVWLGLGAVAARVGASAGPIFVDRILPGSGVYDDMFAYLASVSARFDLITFEGRELLWTAFQEGKANPFLGISAFPSIHVSMVALYVFAFWRSGTRLVYLAGVYAVLIVLSSVHLGWHYSADAYGGVLGTLACWLLAGFWVRRSGSELRPETEI